MTVFYLVVENISENINIVKRILNTSWRIRWTALWERTLGAHIRNAHLGRTLGPHIWSASAADPFYMERTFSSAHIEQGRLNKRSCHYSHERRIVLNCILQHARPNVRLNASNSDSDSEAEGSRPVRHRKKSSMITDYTLIARKLILL